MHNQDVEDICRNVYADTKKYYCQSEEALGEYALGFRILYGPPVVDAPFLFLGYQPGGRAVDCVDHHETWPETCDYATEDWPLAKQVRAIWGAEVVARCTGLNAIFFRAPSVVAWNRIAKTLRDDLEIFSLHNAERIVRALRPEFLIIIGLGTFDWLTQGEPSLYGEKGRVLARRGTLWGRIAIGTVHLSGSRISRIDRDRLRAYFAAIQTTPRTQQTQEPRALPMLS